MVENFNAVIGANIREFVNRAATVDRTIREMATGAVVDVGANIGEFMSEATTVQTVVSEITRGENNVSIDATVREAISSIATVEAAVQAVTGGDNDVEIDANIGGFLRGAAQVRAQTLAFARERIVIPINTRWNNYKNTMGQIANFSRSLGEIGTMTAGGIKIAMSPAIVPVLASVVGLVGQLGPMLGTVAGSTFALGSAFGTAGIGAAAFGAIAVTNLKDIFGASEELKKLDEKLAAADGWKERQAVMKEIAAVQGSLNAEQAKGLAAMNDLKAVWSGIAGSLQTQTIQIFTAALGIMSGVLTDLKPMFTSVMDAAKNLTAALGATINAEPMQNFFNYLNTTAGPMFETMTKAVGNFVQGFLNMMVAFGPLATETAGSFLKMSESFAAWGASLTNNQQFQSFVAYVSENMPKIRSIFADAMAGIINTFAAFAPSSATMMTGLQSLMERFRAWSQTVAESQGFQNFVSYVQTNGPVVVAAIGNIITFITNLGIALAPLGAAMLGIINNFLSWTNAMMQNHPVIGKIIAGGVLLGGTLLAMMPHVIGLATLFVGLPIAMQTAVVGMVKTAAAFVLNWAKIAVASTVNAAKVAAGWVLSTGAAMVTSVAKMTATAALFVAKWTLIGAQALVHGAKVAAGWALSTGAALATATAKMVSTAAVFAARWVFMGAQALAQAARMAAAWFIALGPIGWVTGAVIALAALIIANWDKISAATSRIWSSISKAVSQAWEKTKQVTTEALAVVAALIATLPGKVLAFRSQMLSAGADLIRGLIDGIKNMGSAAVDAISGVVGGVISKAKSLLNINSPSRVFRDFGGFISEGLAIGVESKENAAVRAVTSMANAMTDAFNPQLATAGVSMGGVSMAPMDVGRQMDGVGSRVRRDLKVDTSASQSGNTGGGIVIHNPTYNIEASSVKEFNDVVRLFDKQRLRQQ